MTDYLPLGYFITICRRNCYASTSSNTTTTVVCDLGSIQVALLGPDIHYIIIIVIFIIFVNRTCGEDSPYYGEVSAVAVRAELLSLPDIAAYACPGGLQV